LDKKGSWAIKIQLIGLGVFKTLEMASPSALDFRPEEATVKEIRAWLEGQGVPHTPGLFERASVHAVWGTNSHDSTGIVFLGVSVIDHDR
jgi:hypothetical protein